MIFFKSRKSESESESEEEEESRFFLAFFAAEETDVCEAEDKA